MMAMSTSMTSRVTAALRKGLARLRRRPQRPGRETRGDVHIVPKDSIAANALAAVVAIMTFLAAVTSGGGAVGVGSADQKEAGGGPGKTHSGRPPPPPPPRTGDWPADA